MPSKQKTPHAPRNYKLPGGIYRFSRARMFAKRGIYKKKFVKPAAKVEGKKELFQTKKIGGDKNGGERKVAVSRQPRSQDTERERRIVKPKNKLPFSKHRRHLKSSLTPGTVVIMLAGTHKGKRAVFLKQLNSGLLLVTGPMKLNRCPMRRINQIYVIATSTKLDMSNVKIPDHINDEYFRRRKRQRRRAKESEADIFASKQEGYVVSDQRKDDQKAVDGALLAAIRKSPDKKYLFGYLGSSWGLRKNEYPHKMLF